MILWYKHKHPKFWKDYQNSFRKHSPSSIENTRFVVIDTETTGLNSSKDKILSIGAIGICNNRIVISDSFEIYLNQDKFNPETVKIHGILKEGNLEKFDEAVAIENFIDFINNAVLIAHHAAFDIEMINAALKKMRLPKLKNKRIDTGFLYKKLTGKKEGHFSLDFLCDEFKIPKSDRHTALGDAFITALLFLKIVAKLKRNGPLNYFDLFKNQERNGLL